jgi:serine/threonine-protein kinase RsbW
MGFKIVYINRDNDFIPKEIGPNVYQISSNDLLLQINNVRKLLDVHYFVFEDIDLLRNTNLRYIEDKTCPVIFRFNTLAELESGIETEFSNPLWAMCNKTACNSYFEDFLEIHKAIKDNFSHTPQKTVSFSFESSLSAIEFATSVLERFTKTIFPDISNLDFFQYNLILRELLTNAVKHGNKHDSSKNILLTIFSNKEDRFFGFAVKDQGEGFNFNDRLKTIKTDELRINQRGLFLIKEFCSSIYSKDNLIITEIK